MSRPSLSRNKLAQKAELLFQHVSQDLEHRIATLKAAMKELRRTGDKKHVGSVIVNRYWLSRLVVEQRGNHSKVDNVLASSLALCHEFVYNHNTIWQYGLEYAEAQMKILHVKKN